MYKHGDVSTYCPAHLLKRAQVRSAYLTWLSLHTVRITATCISDWFVRENAAWKTFWELRVELKWEWGEEYEFDMEWKWRQLQDIYDAVAEGRSMMIIPDRTMLDDHYDEVVLHHGRVILRADLDQA